MSCINLAGVLQSTIALSGVLQSTITLTGTVCGWVSAVLVPWALDFSTEDHSSYVALF